MLCPEGLLLYLGNRAGLRSCGAQCKTFGGSMPCGAPLLTRIRAAPRLLAATSPLSRLAKFKPIRASGQESCPMAMLHPHFDRQLQSKMSDTVQGPSTHRTQFGHIGPIAPRVPLLEKRDLYPKFPFSARRTCSRGRKPKDATHN